MISFVLFNAADFTQAGRDILGLLGLGGVPAVTAESLYYLRSYGLLFLMGFVGATPLLKNWAETMSSEKYPRTMAILEPVFLLLLLLICTAYLVDGSFNPFLYFRF